MNANPTSLQSGFARTRSEAEFPNLFPDVGWWCPSLSPPGGTRLHDLSGRQNWGTLTGMDAATDWVVSGGRGALDFDGVDDQCRMTVTAANYLKSITVSMSVLIYASQKQYARIIEKGANTEFNFVVNEIANDGKVTFSDRYGGSINRVTTSIRLDDGVWRHICLVAKPNKLEIYINGKLDNSLNYTSGSYITDAGDLFLARYGGAGDYFGKFQLDDIRIYNRALSASEVRQLYQLGRGNMPRIRSRRYTQQDTSNRRRRVILGAEC